MSLRARLLVGIGVVAVVLALVSAWVYRTTEDHLMGQVDDQLARAVPQVGRLAPIAEGGPEGQGPEGALPGADADPADRGPSTMYVALLTRRGLHTLFEPQLGSEAGLPDLDAERVSAELDRPPFTVTSIGSDGRYRVQVRSTGRQGWPVAYALPLDDVDDTVHRLLVVEVGGSAAVLAVLGLVTFWVLRLGVRPVKQMTATASAIGAGDLSRRIPSSAPGTEAGDLGVALNRMLGRIEESFEARLRSEQRLRQFVADASHELRTPVTTIRGYAELYRHGGLQEPTELSEAMRRTEQEAVRMSALVEDLLHLARLDQGRSLDLVPVDVAGVIADTAADVRAVDPRRPVTVTADGPLTVVADDANVRQVAANLVANARVHTAPDTPIHLSAQGIPGGIRFAVADEGEGMAPAVAARAFERFYRADPARSRHTGGSGLGLAIVSAIVEAHHGRIALDSAPGRGTRVVVELPDDPRSVPTSVTADPQAATGDHGPGAPAGPEHHDVR